jgi:chromosome segregation protein
LYLKSLTLKGFKSFADRTSMSFDPGLNVVVGPNGSGKSNVSDAILWVLGEQSAKMLRGQAMEDVIFSGSSARPAVGVAEVTLVLDNSDHTLPIDFSEVGITRRMYRSGESEYLINGAPARLMDVQDILHDSGLGKDTHSIISQGKLDSILQSRPEERRELIEEAADISKHRRRKERSLRKLSSMDDNLARAKVVEREINRQLKPLERQVDKAKRAHDITERLTELRTQLAVDDLRRLQASYGTLSARGREADAAVELAQYRLDEKSAELEKYQSLLEQKGLFVGDLGEQRRRMQDILGRMDSDMRLLEEKGKNMVSRLSEMRMQLSTMRKQRADVTEEHERVAGDLSDARVRQRELEEGMEALSKASRDAVAHRRELEDTLNKRQADERQARAEADRETLAFAKLEDQISNAEVKDGMYKSRLEQVAETLATTEEALAERGERKARVEAQLADARAKAEELAGTIAEAQAALKRARDEERSSRTKLSSSEATLSALRSVDANVEKASPLVEAVSKGKAADLVECRLADLIDADEATESLVERLLGDDLAAFVVASAADAGALAASALSQGRAEGRATVVFREAAPAAVAAEGAHGEALISHLRVSDAARPLLTALLGDIRLVGSAEEAIRAHQAMPALTYVTQDGVTVTPDGRCVVGTTPSTEAGALERKRRIRALEEGMGELRASLGAATEAVSAAEAALAASRDGAAAAKGDVARLSGELSSVTSEMGRLEAQLRQASSEQAQVSKNRAAAAERAGKARKEVERHKAAADEAEKRTSELSSKLEEASTERQRASHEENETQDKLSDAKLKLATIVERRNHLAVREEELSRQVADLEKRRKQTEESSRALDVLRLRVEPLHERYEAVHERALAWAARLKDRASLAEADSDSLKKTIADAREAVSAAQGELDRANGVASNVKVEVGKLEVQVENAINDIVSRGYVLEDALALPEPEDRVAMEKTVARIKRELSDMGPVNEVAMDEYERLKKRSDYIGEQVG